MQQIDSIPPLTSHSKSARAITAAEARLSRLMLLLSIVGAALLTGMTLVSFAPPPVGEPELILLLRFMALLKGAIALIGAVAVAALWSPLAGS